MRQGEIEVGSIEQVTVQKGPWQPRCGLAVSRSDREVPHEGKAKNVYGSDVSLKPAVIGCWLGAIMCVLVLASIGGQFVKYVISDGALAGHLGQGLVRLVDVDSEQNIPTYFSMLLLLFAAQLLAVITVLNRKQRRPYGVKWAILTIGFLFMAYDEAFQVHDKLTGPIKQVLGDQTLGIFYFAWVIPGIVLVFAVGAFFLKFLLFLPPADRFRFLAAAALYLAGAIGFEMIGGSYAKTHGINNLTYSLITTVEESLEMTGLIVFIWALLNYYRDHYKEVVFKIES